MVLALAPARGERALPAPLGRARRPDDRASASSASKACEKLVRAVLGERVKARGRRRARRARGRQRVLPRGADPRASPRGDGERLPETVLAMVQARLEALEPEARRVLRAASVFGQVFWSRRRQRAARRRRGDPAPSRVARRARRARGDRPAPPPRRFPGEPSTRSATRSSATPPTRCSPTTIAMLGHRLAGDVARAGRRGRRASCSPSTSSAAASRRAPCDCYLRAAEQALEGNDFAAVLDRAPSAASPAARPASCSARSPRSRPRRTVAATTSRPRRASPRR